MIVLDQTKMDRVPLLDIQTGECFKYFSNNSEKICVKTSRSEESTNENWVLDVYRGDIYRLDENILVTPVTATLTVEPCLK